MFRWPAFQKMHGGDVGRTSQTTTKRKPYQAVSQPSSEDVATSNNEAPPPRMTGNDSSNTIQPLLSNNPQVSNTYNCIVTLFNHFINYSIELCVFFLNTEKR